MNNNCISGKLDYVNEDVAVEALIQHHIINYLDKFIATNVYRCEDCGSWHFTSQGVHKVFNDSTIQERIKREALAYQWERKLR